MGAVVVAAHVATLPPFPYSHCFHDEFQYAQEARDLAEGRVPRYNRGRVAKYPPLYPAVLAPVWAVSTHQDSLRRARVVNAVLLAATLWPAYRIARRLLGRGAAVCAAGLAMVAPWHGYARQLLSESLAIPLFLAFVHLAIRLAERPGVRRAAAAGAALGALALTKTLFLVLAPPLALALPWALRPRWGRSLALLAVLAGAAALVFLPWQLRGRLPSERGVPAYYDYAGEFYAYPPASLADHVEIAAEHAIGPLLALGAPLFALALAGLGRTLRATKPGVRALGALGLGSMLVLLAVASVWTTQCRLNRVTERYVLPVWPLLTVLGVAELWRGRAGWRAPALAVLPVIFVPDHALVLDGPSQYPFDGPSYCQAAWLTVLTGSTLATRAILAGTLAFLAPWAFARRWGPTLVLAVSALWGANAFATFRIQPALLNEMNARDREPVWRWLDRWIRPGDTLVHHTHCAGMAFANALRYDSDYCQLDFRLFGDGDSNASFDFDAFEVTFPFAPPRGSLWLLSPHDLFEQVPDWPLVDRFEEYRLHRLPAPGTSRRGRPEAAAPGTHLRATAILVGTGCGGPKPPRLGAELPQLGVPQTLRLRDAAPRAPVRLLVGLGPPAPLPLGACTLFVRHAVFVSLDATDDNGAWSFTLRLPEQQALAGLDVTLQALIEIAGGPILGRAQLSNAIHQRFGL
jgi:hypothetical protein